MAVFARRCIQDSIDRCATFFTPAHLADAVGRLNASDETSLATEWEVMVSAAVSRLCPVQHEPDLGGPRRGDILMLSEKSGTTGCLVEVTTISDDFVRGANPVERYEEAIFRRLGKLGCPVEGFHIQVGGDTTGDFGDARMMLHLGKGSPSDLIDARFDEFAKRLRAAPDQPASHHWLGDGLDIKLTYTPNKRGVESGYPSYNVPYSATRNTLFKALKKKCTQLIRTGHPGPFGVIVCDGGCGMLSSSLSASGGAASVRDIIQRHFATDSLLSFVIVVRAELTLPSFFNGHTQERLLRATPFVRAGADGVATRAARLLAGLPSVMPRPRLEAHNAARCYRDGWEEKGLHGYQGTITMSDNTIRLSARAVLEMLAGTKTPDQFFAGFSGKGPFAGNHFSALKSNGRLITRVEFVKGDDDDDQIEFTFGPPDPAVSPFRVPPPANVG